jgi:predicted nucleic acid-binding protein
LASTAAVIAETGWLLLDRDGPNAQREFIGSILTGDITVIDLTAADWTRVHELIAIYADVSLDIIDASTIAAAERLNQTTIATLDERDFRIVRPTHTDTFELLPGPV